MEELTKTYTLRNCTFLCLCLEVDDKKTWIEFKSLRSYLKGTFTTSDPAIMEALENHKEFDKEFYISKVRGEEGGKEVVPEKEDEKVKETQKVEIPEETATEPKKEVKAAKEVKTVPGITKVIQAREYLLDNIKGISANSVSNKEKVLKMAANNNIVFPDLI